MTALALIAARACEKVIVAHFRRRFRALAHDPAATPGASVPRHDCAGRFGRGLQSLSRAEGSSVR